MSLDLGLFGGLSNANRSLSNRSDFREGTSSYDFGGNSYGDNSGSGHSDLYHDSMDSTPASRDHGSYPPSRGSQLGFQSRPIQNTPRTSTHLDLVSYDSPSSTNSFNRAGSSISNRLEDHLTIQDPRHFSRYPPYATLFSEYLQSQSMVKTLQNDIRSSAEQIAFLKDLVGEFRRTAQNAPPSMHSTEQRPQLPAPPAHTVQAVPSIAYTQEDARRVNEELNPADFPNIKYWEEDIWDKEVVKRKERGQLKLYYLDFFQNRDGDFVGRPALKALKRASYAIWHVWKACGVLPRWWTEKRDDAFTYYKIALHSQFSWVFYCIGGWKLRVWATAQFPGFKRQYFDAPTSLLSGSHSLQIPNDVGPDSSEEEMLDDGAPPPKRRRTLDEHSTKAVIESRRRDHSSKNHRATTASGSRIPVPVASKTSKSGSGPQNSKAHTSAGTTSKGSNSSSGSGALDLAQGTVSTSGTSGSLRGPSSLSSRPNPHQPHSHSSSSKDTRSDPVRPKPRLKGLPVNSARSNPAPTDVLENPKELDSGGTQISKLGVDSTTSDEVPQLDASELHRRLAGEQRRQHSRERGRSKSSIRRSRSPIRLPIRRSVSPVRASKSPMRRSPSLALPQPFSPGSLFDRPSDAIELEDLAAGLGDAHKRVGTVSPQFSFSYSRSASPVDLAQKPLPLRMDHKDSPIVPRNPLDSVLKPPVIKFVPPPAGTMPAIDPPDDGPKKKAKAKKGDSAADLPLETPNGKFTERTLFLLDHIARNEGKLPTKAAFKEVWSAVSEEEKKKYRSLARKRLGEGVLEGMLKPYVAPDNPVVP